MIEFPRFKPLPISDPPRILHALRSFIRESVSTAVVSGYELDIAFMHGATMAVRARLPIIQPNADMRRQSLFVAALFHQSAC